MDKQPTPKVVNAERSRDGVLIEFADGRVAFYTASLLADMFSQAAQVEELDLD
jgi:hypothetical protein